ncbi:MAG: class IIb bacteriocin, lactobin A/cerein 7B family [Pseudomonadales bacterium]|jgi:lactobin A/cerein 7B family class IIb bacteriocin|nr:class IIb bacteriocin, lactobin A/cerein 7B family [Pseudomonadales bacterium]MDP6471515.1 class IIb bacteriocin, lactobin A/cerein 7B family [Pseudomonadales bacterium]MDP6829236.1 class IIb bacteriocin, lactobin A/cerein 7B family [Pseudomonadales bacterium]MDP6970640.1 class IIb bacteriocin, lactobin A/cerein 7B family [Pseudomonadales bacterium]|tara:strand:+ start:380 stop:583 length:204 start_codon:yes stop_codon:yes gene_type:complete
MRELTANEIEATTGGVLPIVGIGIAIASKLSATGLAGWALSSAGLILSSYQVAEHYLEPKLKQIHNQ